MSLTEIVGGAVGTTIAGVFLAFLAHRLSQAKSEGDDKRTKIEEAEICLTEITLLVDDYTSRIGPYISYIDRSERPAYEGILNEDHKYFVETRKAVLTKTARLISLSRKYIGSEEFYQAQIEASLDRWNRIGQAIEQTILYGEADEEIEHPLEIVQAHLAFFCDLEPLRQLISDRSKDPLSTPCRRRISRGQRDFVGFLEIDA